MLRVEILHYTGAYDLLAARGCQHLHTRVLQPEGCKHHFVVFCVFQPLLILKHRAGGITSLWWHLRPRGSNYVGGILEYAMKRHRFCWCLRPSACMGGTYDLLAARLNKCSITEPMLNTAYFFGGDVARVAYVHITLKTQFHQKWNLRPSAFKPSMCTFTVVSVSKDATMYTFTGVSVSNDANHVHIHWGVSQ